MKFKKSTILSGWVWLLWINLLVWWIITSQNGIFTVGVVNIIIAVILLLTLHIDYKNDLLKYLGTIIEQYWRTIVVLWCYRFILKVWLFSQWLYELVILVSILLWIVSIRWKVPPLRRWKAYIRIRLLLWIVSFMVVLVIFQKHRALDTPRLIVTAFGWWWVVYALWMAVSNKITLRDPLLITRWLLTIITSLRAFSTVLIDAYEDRKIETIVYQEKEVYLPAQSCLPDWWNIQMIEKQ